jgi:GDP-L-fucose synthase
MDKLLILGSTGMIGSNACKYFKNKDYEILAPKRIELNLLDDNQIKNYIKYNRPKFVVNASGLVGGIKSNLNNSIDFLSLNLKMSLNLIAALNEYEIKHFVNFGSSCMYPIDAPQPYLEKSILDGIPEHSSLNYAINKLATWKLVDSYFYNGAKFWKTIIPCSIFGPGDNFSVDDGHVIPSLIYKFHTAKNNSLPSVALWGDGSPLREFLYVDDLLEAVEVLLTRETEFSTYNVGSGREISIRKLACLIADVVDYRGEIIWGDQELNGAKRKVLDSDRISKLGWVETHDLESALRKTYLKYKSNSNFLD